MCQDCFMRFVRQKEEDCPARHSNFHIGGYKKTCLALSCISDGVHQVSPGKWSVSILGQEDQVIPMSRVLLRMPCGGSSSFHCQLCVNVDMLFYVDLQTHRTIL